jgi:hypothetical protein
MAIFYEITIDHKQLTLYMGDTKKETLYNIH